MCGPLPLFEVLLISALNLAEYILPELECAILVGMLDIQCYSKRLSKFSAGEGQAAERRERGGNMLHVDMMG